MPRIANEQPDPIDIHVGKRIAALRLERQLNQSQLGKALGLTFQQVQKYEKGTNRVSASKLYRTAEFLGVKVEYFFDGLEGSDNVIPMPVTTAMTDRYMRDVAASWMDLPLQARAAIALLVHGIAPKD